MDVINTIGRRKASVARIYMSEGKGTITVNDRPLE
jgi:small subunit ribosomal protein S9